mmetsp:Transcript_1034/g.3255  ORF Transcript_1034/g.3255 Transcript_1034/m.3255 type:complete len:224 (-) Transcript_1034:181-852(-)
MLQLRRIYRRSSSSSSASSTPAAFRRRCSCTRRRRTWSASAASRGWPTTSTRAECTCTGRASRRRQCLVGHRRRAATRRAPRTDARPTALPPSDGGISERLSAWTPRRPSWTPRAPRRHSRRPRSACSDRTRRWWSRACWLPRCSSSSARRGAPRRRSAPWRPTARLCASRSFIEMRLIEQRPQTSAASSSRLCGARIKQLSPSCSASSPRRSALESRSRNVC